MVSTKFNTLFWQESLGFLVSKTKVGVCLHVELVEIQLVFKFSSFGFSK